MKNRFRKQALCILLALSLVMGFMPVTSFAGWEDGEECEFCGRYRFDDWLCDCGPHCSESSATDDCFLENHCAGCLEAVANSERCDTCYLCPDCMSDGVVLHCAICGACDEGGYDVCPDCDVCINCQIEAGTHCFECGDCLESGSQCPDHPFELYQENHCESCALKCPGCEDKCFLGEIFIDIYCEEHELCVVCATDEGLHCKECYGCYEDELCSDCQLCDECGLESGNHCPECDAHSDDWCETGGEGTHCVECASEYLCEQCDVCTSCSEIEFCDECGLCIECCRENAESENCSCGEYCIESANWEEHFCADCGTCFDENEQCETCEYCVECCASQSECSESMCVEDIEYDEHFCEQCQQCFHDVEACESCQDAGMLWCIECCMEETENQGCEHEYCTNSWQWDEHYCDICGKCYGDVDCTHDATAHIHTYDANGNCTVCGYNKDGKPVITKQPKSVMAKPGDAAAVYTVEAMGDNLTYQWYYINLSTGKPVAMTDGTAYKGTKTKRLMVAVADGMCSLGKPVQIFCVVKNLNGNVTSSTVDFLVAHQYDKYTTDKTHHWYTCKNCSKIKDQAEHRFNAWTIVKQASQTENGLKRRVCYDCNYADTVTIPKLPADHVHDYSAAFVKTDTFHWTKCACGNENKGAMEEHNFGNGWVTTIQPTLTSVGEETRTCGVCGYVETREIEKQGHTHEFYNEEYLENHKDNGNSGYLLNNGYIVNLYSEPYGKKTNTYHYAYCVVDGCDAYERYTHKWYTEWYDVPTDAIDGSYEKKCSDCFYTTGLKSLPAGKYRVITKNCTTNIQAAAPGSTVKISLYKDYPAGYFPDINASYPNIDVNYTWGNGASGTWKMIEEEYHAPDEKNPKGYWTFTMPEVPKDKNTDWLNFYVEVEVELFDCSEDNHGDGRGFEWTNVKEATCGQPGYTGDYKCKWCNYIKERGHDTPATGKHGELIAEADYLGDCEHAGYTGAKRCSVCDEIIVPREYHGKTHKVTKVPDTYIAATCTSKGQTAQYNCGRCGIVLTKSKTIAKLPHDWEQIEGTATCTEGGILDHVKCKSCGQISIDGGTTILRNTAKLKSGALGHIYDEGTVIKAATCMTAGEKLYTCTGDGCNVTKKETIAKLTTHNWNAGEVTTPATCRDAGVKTFTCTVAGCGQTKTEPIQKDTNKHVGGTELVNVKAADHKSQTAGYTGDTKCLGCGAILSSGTTVAPETHKAASAWTIDGTYHWKVCTVGGCGVAMDKAAHGYGDDYVCDVCGYENETLKPTPDPDPTPTPDPEPGTHKCAPKLVKGKAATCTEAGQKDFYECSCGKYYEDVAGTKTIVDIDGWGKIAKVSTVKLSYTKKVYNGSTFKAPELTIKDSDGKVLENGRDYEVNGLVGKKSVGRYTVKVTFKGDYAGSKSLYFNIVPKKVSSATAKLNSADAAGGYDDVKFTWKKSTGATGYMVYYKKSSASKYTFLKSTTGTSVTKKNLDDGVKYTFKVVPYYKKSGSSTKYYKEDQYKTASVTTLKKVTGIKVSKSGTKVKVSWTNINGETGYQISKMTKKSATQKTPLTVKSATAKSKLVTATKGKTYYYKVRAYKIVDNKKVYGPWSIVKAYKRK